MIQPNFGAIQQAMRLRKAMNCVRREIVALKSDDINAAWTGGMAFAKHKWGNVVNDTRQARHKSVAANSREMMHADSAAERGVVVDVHMASQKRGIGHNDVVAKLAVVGYVAGGHQEVVMPDPRNAVFLLASAIDRHPFADDVVRADHHLRLATSVADILRLRANDDTREEMVVFSQNHLPHKRHVVFQPSPTANFYVGTNDAERPDRHVVADFGTRVDRDVVSDGDGHSDQQEYG